MIHELRIYEPIPGKLGAVNARFADSTVDLFRKHGLAMLGFWTAEIGIGPELTYIVSFEDMADRDRKWASFQGDPVWQKIRAESEKDGLIMDRFRNTIMKLTQYSPNPPKVNSNVQELRIYDAMPGKLPNLHARFANHSTGFFRQYGMDVIGYWTDDVGISNRLTYMLGYPSLGDREKSWAAFNADPAWHKVVDESQRDGTLVKAVYSTILRPTAYSPR